MTMEIEHVEEVEPLTDEEVSKAMAEHTMLGVDLIMEAMGLAPKQGDKSDND